VEKLKEKMEECKKKYWEEVGVCMGRSGRNCQRAAKDAHLKVAMY
jgi:hypothetical protein